MAKKLCSNYRFCENELSIYDKCKSMCPDCDLIFGKWKGGRGKPDIKDKIKCPICLEKKLCITQPNCAHFVCFDCFRRCQYGDDLFDKDNEPKFPYDKNIESEYYYDLENPEFKEFEGLINLETHKLIESKYEAIRQKWYIKYPLIKEYNKKKN